MKQKDYDKKTPDELRKFGNYLYKLAANMENAESIEKIVATGYSKEDYFINEYYNISEFTIPVFSKDDFAKYLDKALNDLTIIPANTKFVCCSVEGTNDWYMQSDEFYTDPLNDEWATEHLRDIKLIS